MAMDLNISQSSIKNIVRKNLKITADEMQRVHGLTEKQKLARVVRSRELQRRHADCEIILFDEKMFLLQDTHNQQNDRIYATKLADIPKDKLAVQRFQNVSRVMVWGGFSRNVKLPLLFIEAGVKINTNYYIEHVLKNHLLAHASNLIPDGNYCFQQDSAPSHQSKATQEWCRRNLPHFISSQEWPASSPDLNPLDYFAWGYLLSKTGSMKGLELWHYSSSFWLLFGTACLRKPCVPAAMRFTNVFVW
jgi:inhibitor of nuclear factor kappa-B kinase subunit alpha